VNESPRIRTLQRSERGAFIDLMRAAFDETFMFDRYLDHDRGLGDGDTLVALVDGRIVSAVQIFTRAIRLRGREIRLGGIGSVATHPDFERRGISSELLRRAIAEMKRRGMALSLLFTGRVSFYERLDWVRIDHPVRVLHRGSTVDGVEGIEPFDEADLDEIKALYGAYCAERDLTTYRDDAYWAGQLRCAGNPDEDFRVLRRDGRIRAYVRCIPFEGLVRVSEFGRVEDAAEDLARLLLTITPDERPLFLPEAGDAAMLCALEDRAAKLDAIAFPDQMWRVLDRPRLAELDDEDGEGDDAALLTRLVGRPGATYWPSDRF
jgi:predicted acetyltransferase